MARMKEKIKNFFGFVGRAWRGGIRGKTGIAFALFAAFIVLQMFIGDVSIQKSIANVWRLRAEQAQLDAEAAKLDALRRHIRLLQAHSPDYVEELGLRYLNIGGPKTRVLKI